KASGGGGRLVRLTVTRHVLAVGPERLPALERRGRLLGSDDADAFARRRARRRPAFGLVLVHGGSPVVEPASGTGLSPASFCLSLGSDVEELLLLVLQDAVDLGHVMMGDLLELLLGPLQLVRGDVSVVLQGLELVAGCASQVTGGHLALLGL